MNNVSSITFGYTVKPVRRSSTQKLSAQSRRSSRRGARKWASGDIRQGIRLLIQGFDQASQVPSEAKREALWHYGRVQLRKAGEVRLRSLG